MPCLHCVSQGILGTALALWVSTSPSADRFELRILISLNLISLDCKLEINTFLKTMSTQCMPCHPLLEPEGIVRKMGPTEEVGGWALSRTRCISDPCPKESRTPQDWLQLLSAFVLTNAWLCGDADVDVVARQLSYSTNPRRLSLVSLASHSEAADSVDLEMPVKMRKG